MSLLELIVIDMGLFSSNKENPALQQQQAREEVLNDAKFMESLDSNPNIDINTDTEKLKEAHEAFKSKEATSRELQGLFKKEISRDLGLNFDSAENKQIFEEIDKYLSAELINNPQRITELKGEIVKFHDFQEKIDAQKKILEQLGESTRSLSEKQGALLNVEVSKKMFQKLRAYSTEHAAARQKAEQEYGLDLSNIRGDIAQLREKLKIGDSAEAELTSLQDKFADLRKSILQDLAPMEVLQGMAQEKVKQKIEQMTDPTKPENLSVKNLEQAKQFFDKLAADNFQINTGLDYKPEDVDLLDFYNTINEKLENAFSADVEEAIDKVKGSSLTLKGMTQALKPMFEKASLGDKNAKEVKNFLLDYLKELMPTLPKSKQILITVAIESFA